MGQIKKLIDILVLAVCPIDYPEIESALKQNFNESELEKVNIFYCPGGFEL